MALRKYRIGAALLAFGVFAAPVSAATLQIEDGQLMGATGVDVGGSLYDVAFRPGACDQIFIGCDEVADFSFGTQEDAERATQSLIDEVLLDGPEGMFATNTSLIFGIRGGNARIATPWGFTDRGNAEVVFAENDNLFGLWEVETGSVFPEFDFSRFQSVVFAEWSESALVAPIPVPAGGVLLISALLGVAGARRRKS